MAIFRGNDDVIKASRDEMPIFLRFSKFLRTTYPFAKFCDLTHFQSNFKWELGPKYLGGNRVKIGFLKNFVKLTKIYLCRSLSLSTLRHAAFLKRDSDTVTLLWILWIFWKQHFYRTLRLLLSLWNVFAISINLILFSQCGFPLPLWVISSVQVKIVPTI